MGKNYVSITLFLVSTDIYNKEIFNNSNKDEKIV